MKYIIGGKCEDNGPGVKRKIKEQMDVFNNVGLKCSLYSLSFCNKNSITKKILRRFPFVNLHKHWNISDLKDEDLLYIRRFGEWDGSAVDFFKYLKHHNPNMKIVYEIPTYPYDDEAAISLKDWPLLIKDKWNRRYLYKFIDRIATLTDDTEIFGVPTLKIGNGIDVEKIRLRQVTMTNDIHAIAVANFGWWHGYDRFFEGMKGYYASDPERKVIFHLVGKGSELDRYQKMITDYGLEDYVIIHGQQTGKDLDAIYDQCNLGIASLGCYRKGISETQELKSREYLAKGLPFVSSVKITDIPDADKDNIYLQVSNNDSPIDIESILEFYDRIYSEDAEQVNKRLRKFAKDYFSMEVAMKEVIDFFKDGK